MSVKIILSWDSQFCVLMGQRSKFLNYDKLMFSKIKNCYILAYSADPDEMLHKAAFHLGLHFLPKYLFISIQNEKDKAILPKGRIQHMN